MCAQEYLNRHSPIMIHGSTCMLPNEGSGGNDVIESWRDIYRGVERSQPSPPLHVLELSISPLRIEELPYYDSGLPVGEAEGSVLRRLGTYPNPTNTHCGSASFVVTSPPRSSLLLPPPHDKQTTPTVTMDQDEDEFLYSDAPSAVPSTVTPLQTPAVATPTPAPSATATPSDVVSALPGLGGSGDGVDTPMGDSDAGAGVDPAGEEDLEEGEEEEEVEVEESDDVQLPPHQLCPAIVTGI